MFKVILFILLLITQFSLAKGNEVKVITTDIQNYWKAYDLIQTEADSLKRLRLLKQHYLDPGTPGLAALMSARNYRPQEYIDAMLNYPAYWESIRPLTLKANELAVEIRKNIGKLAGVYPEMKPATVYFAFGVFRSSGTYADGMVLLGAELLFANQQSVKHELPIRIQNYITNYMPQNIPLIATHEFIHTQQKPWINSNILVRCVAEGVAEFISTQLLDAPLSPPVKFGKKNADRVLDQFMIELFRDDDVSNWLWSQNTNVLQENDLGYYIGYAICERYYQKAENKNGALAELIMLEYENESVFGRFLDGSAFLPLSLQEIGDKYDSLRPTVTGILEFNNGSMNVPAYMKEITLLFSEPMNSCCRSSDLSENQSAVPFKIQNAVWSTDGLQLKYQIESLKPNTHYELIVSNFAKADGGNRTRPYLIQFKTAATPSR